MVDNNCILRHLKYYWKERKGKRIRQGRRWELSVQERKSQIYKEAQEGFKCNLEGLASLRHFIRLVSGTIKEKPEAKKKKKWWWGDKKKNFPNESISSKPLLLIKQINLLHG